MNDGPRVLFVGRTRYRLPLEAGLARKWDALAERLDVRVLASGTGADPRFDLVRPRALDGPRFYAGLTLRVARALRSFRPEVVIAESPYEAVAVELARRLTRFPVIVVAEVHGDWRTSTRLYGSPLRRLVSPLGDRLATWALRRADAHRAISGFTSDLVRGVGREPAAVFPTYSDLSAFTGTAQPFPDEPQVLYVGALERLKNVDVLAAAWRQVRQRVPAARLRVLGAGPEHALVDALVREGGARWDERVPPQEVARALDESSLLVLPSSSEGLGRVIVEAFLRARPVVASDVGGIRDLVADGVTGLLVAPRDADALAAAVERLLTDKGLAERLGLEALASVQPFAASPVEYAHNVAELVERVR